MSGATLIFTSYLAIAVSWDHPSTDALLEDPDIGPHGRERGLEVALQPAEHVGGVLVGTTHGLLGLRFGPRHDVGGVRLRTPHQVVVSQQQRGLLLRRR